MSISEANEVKEVIYHDTLRFAKDLAKEAGDLISSNRPGRISIKEGVEIVTDIDTQVEELLTLRIRASKYNFPLLSEETPIGEIDTRYLWVIDPIDGTTNFSKGIPRVSCSIALVHEGQSVIGVIYNPFTRELFWAKKGKGAFKEGYSSSLKVPDTSNLAEAVVCIDAGYNTSEDRKRGVNLYSLLAPPVTRGIRQMASAALDLCDVATGHFDAYVATSSQKISAWDFSAGGLILEEAGGEFTDFKGNKWHLQLHDRLASNGILHERLLEIVTSL